MNKLIFPALLSVIMAGCYKNDDVYTGDSVIPVTLKGIETVNVDNSGEAPAVAAEGVGKSAYMIGVKWIADDLPQDYDDDNYVGGPVHQGQQTYDQIADSYVTHVHALTQFNAEVGPTTNEETGETWYPNISNYFQSIDRWFSSNWRTYLPEGVDHGLVLLKAPNPGQHSFRVEYVKNGAVVFKVDTEAILFY